MAGLYQPCRQSVTKLLFLGETTKINKEKIRDKERKRYIHKKSYCKICGVKLPHGRQKFCLECLLKSYKGIDIEKYRRARDILYCRGYDKEMIEDECEERGII